VQLQGALAPVLLSKAELAYLKDSRQFSAEYASTIRYRLNKKLRQFATEELPTLLQNGYLLTLTEFRHASSGFLTENRQQKDNGNGPGGLRSLDIRSQNNGICGSEDRRDILTTLRAQTC
jgi:hypothetical protein